MTSRPIRLPTDIRPATDLALRAFQYPDNQEWSIQSDEKTGIVDSLNTIRRLWPLIGLLRLFSPALRDFMRGWVWEEDGELVGLAQYQRRGTTDHWYISSVAVLPEYRRKGIARRLVQAALESMRRECGQTVALDVIAGNIPAYRLYESLGFERFGGSIELVYAPGEPPGECPLPDGYTLDRINLFDWRPGFELEKRIIPDSVRQYEPVEESAHLPGVVRGLLAVVDRISGEREAKSVIRTDSDGSTVASAGYTLRTRAGGVNYVGLLVDPAHSMLASYLVRYLVGTVCRQSAGRRIELDVPAWQEETLRVARAVGFAERCQYHSMGLELQS